MGPTHLLDILDAYDADRSSLGEGRLPDEAGAWIAFGVILGRSIATPRAERLTYLTDAARVLIPAAASEATRRALAGVAARADDASVQLAISTIAGEAETQGAFAVATTMLDLGRVLVPVSSALLHGRLLAQQARILRELGDTERAIEMYDLVAELGAAGADKELQGRAHLGRATVAQVRGNYPVAREQYHAVLAIVDRVHAAEVARELRTHAHHGLLVAAGVAGDYDTALQYGWKAVDEARDDEHRIELLSNLASVCVSSGQFRAALNGYLSVLANSNLPRVRLSASGGAALAAARVGDKRILAALVEAARPLVEGGEHEYEVADMLREFGDAHAIFGETGAAAHYQSLALDRAKRCGFFEIVHRIESAPSGPPVAAQSHAVPLTAGAVYVVEQLSAGDSDALLAAAVSGGLTRDSIGHSVPTD